MTTFSTSLGRPAPNLAATQRRQPEAVTQRAAHRAERAALDRSGSAATHRLVPNATHFQQPDLSQKLDAGHFHDDHGACRGCSV